MNGWVEEETLDPKDWESLKVLGHRMVDDMLTYLERVREREAWRPVPEAVQARLNRPVPVEPEGAERVYEDFLRDVLPYPTGNIHPRFWGWVMGTGTPFGALAELLGATMNPNVGGFDDAATRVERQVLSWLKEMLGFPSSASGLLVSGGSMANLVGLTVARNARAGYDLREAGLQGAPHRLTLYASSETHSSVVKAAQVLGLGSAALRRIPVDDDFEIDVPALERAIAEDRAAGHRPFCVVGNAGTVNTGAIDDLTALADLCRRDGLWLHVDGAFGALAALSPPLRPLVAGMERADSIAFDLHKWGYVPLEAGCVLVRDPEAQREAFSVKADYLSAPRGGVAALTPKLNDFGIQLSRSFKALKVWMSLKEHGTAKLGRLVHQNVQQASYLASRVRENPELELAAPVPLNVVCFRYVGDRRASLDLDEVNREILIRLQESGLAVPSHTIVRGRYVLRAAITNHRSRREDFDAMVSAVVRIGREIVSSGAGRALEGAQ